MKSGKVAGSPGAGQARALAADGLVLALVVACWLGAAACKRRPPTAEVVDVVAVQPRVLDQRLAAMLEHGAPTCAVYFGGVLEGCAEASAIARYVEAVPAAQRAAAAETCAAFLSTADTTRTLLAAGCIEALPGELVTPHLAVALAALDGVSDGDARIAIARGFRTADAAGAKLEPQILAYVRRLDREAHRATIASTGAYLIETLFGSPDGAPRAASPAAQAWALEALATSANQQFAALRQLSRIADKPAACSALVTSLRRSPSSVEVMSTVMATHDCDAQLAEFFAALVEIVPREPSSVVIRALIDLDARVAIPAALRAQAATALRARHDADAPRFGSDPRSQQFLEEFATGAAHFAAARLEPR